jgi:hypothetical protein
MDSRVLGLVHKSADAAQNIGFLQDAAAVGLRLKINLIPDLPTTSYADALEALAAFERYAECVDDVSVFPFEPTRSSRIGRSPAAFGLTVDSTASAEGQAQDALNHLRSADPAMTSDERLDVYARYAALANRVKAERKQSKYVASFASWEHKLLRIRVADLDMLPVPDGISCTDILNRERILIPARAVEIIRPYLTGESFTLKDLMRRAGDDDFRVLVGSFKDSMLLEVVESSGSEDGVLAGRAVVRAPGRRRPV